MNPKIMMNVQTVLSMTFWFFLTGMIFSPSFPSPGAIPSSNLTPFFGLAGAPEGVPGPDGVKSWGCLRFRFAGSCLDEADGRDDGREGEKDDEAGGDVPR